MVNIPWRPRNRSGSFLLVIPLGFAYLLSMVVNNCRSQELCLYLRCGRTGEGCCSTSATTNDARHPLPIHIFGIFSEGFFLRVFPATTRVTGVSPFYMPLSSNNKFCDPSASTNIYSFSISINCVCAIAESFPSPCTIFYFGRNFLVYNCTDVS